MIFWWPFVHKKIYILVIVIKYLAKTLYEYLYENLYERPLWIIHGLEMKIS